MKRFKYSTPSSPTPAHDDEINETICCFVIFLNKARCRMEELNRHSQQKTAGKVEKKLMNKLKLGKNPAPTC
jgi:hypothetical protein